MRFASLLVLASFATIACAADPSIAVENAWARATPPGSSVAVVYAEITAKHSDAIVSITTPAAERVEMHTTTQIDGAMRMRPIATVMLPPNEVVKFESGGLHVMLLGLRAPLIAGEHIELIFTFRTAASVRTSVKIVAPGAAPHAH